MQDPVSHLPVVIYEYAFFADGGQKFKYVSETSSCVLGFSPGQLMDDPAILRSVFRPEDDAVLSKAFTREPVSQIPVGVRGSVRINNELKQIEIHYTDEVLSDGIVLRRGMIRELERNEGREGSESGQYEELLEKLPIGVVIHHDGIVAFANTHAHFILGAKTPGLKGRNAFDFVHPDCLPGIVERIKKVAAGQAVPMVEEKFFHVNGSMIDVETMGLPFSYRGRPAVQVIFRDITEKKRTEAQLRRNETLFRQLFENIPMAVVMLDGMGKVSETNRGFAKMFGYEDDELKGKNLNDFIVPDNLQNEGIDLNNLIASNRTVSIESIRKHRSGELIDVILYGVPVMQDNEVIGIYGVYVDITGRKKMEEELKIRNTELDNFVYKVSHDLRAPLSSVLGLVNLSRVQGNNDNLFQYMELIGKKVQALDNFIGDVLSHSKNLKMEVDIARVDLETIIEQTFADLSYLEGAAAIKRAVKIEGIDFYSDYWRISEIFRNLISNAIKYRRPQIEVPEIIIKVHVDHLCADISFADNGIGIREDNLRRIFEMFFRASEQGEGSGIGLYIVKNAVEKLGGQIKVASSPGEGTRFHILLPNRVNSSLGMSDIPSAK